MFWWKKHWWWRSGQTHSLDVYEHQKLAMNFQLPMASWLNIIPIGHNSWKLVSTLHWKRQDLGRTKGKAEQESWKACISICITYLNIFEMNIYWILSLPFSNRHSRINNGSRQFRCTWYHVPPAGNRREESWKFPTCFTCFFSSETMWATG